MRTLIRLGRFHDALDELAQIETILPDLLATVLALRLQCAGAVLNWPEVAKLRERSRSLAHTTEAGRAEIAVAHAYDAFYRGDASAMRSALLTITAEAGPRYYVLQLYLLSWAASLLRHYAEQARYLERMVRFIEETPAAMDVALLASAALTLADLSREVPSLNAFEFAQMLADRVAWTPDLAGLKFLTERAIAWGHVARGSHRTAQRMLLACCDAAPSAQWRATIYGELSRIVRMVGSEEAADALLDHAILSARSVSWESAGEERVGLLSLIELSAERDLDVSQALLEAYDGIHSNVFRGLVLAHDRRLAPLEQHARGSALAAAGDGGALALLEQAFETFRDLGYAWRSATSALRLHALTGQRKWITCAAEAIADFPNSPLAAEVRRREGGCTDPRFAALTATQRRAFRLVCEGMSDAQIAGALKVTVYTARNHVAAVRQCFGAHSRSQVVAIARSSGLFI